ncbi:DUF2726 domain-containing protein [Gymnodinialimonas sp.]
MDLAALLQTIPASPALWGAVALLLLLSLLTGKRRRRAPSLRRRLKVIRSANLTPRPVLNQSERRVHRQLAQIVGGSPTHSLLTQVSMGEFLHVAGGRTGRAQRQSVFNAFNAKRVDFLIVDADWLPVVVLEYQGSGHYQGNARARDAIKRAVCETAGIAFMEVASGGLTPAQVRDLRRQVTTQSSVAAE